MRVVVVGATGNVGTSVLAALREDPRVESVLGLARRAPSVELEKVTWAAADITRSALAPHFEGADVVIHLAWVIQPSHDLPTVRATNVNGSQRVFRAVGDAGVPALVYASSIGAYSPAPKASPVDESWPTDGVESSFYSRQKAEVERLLDRFERDAPDTRVVRLRPGLIFKRDAGSEVRRLFAGPLLPRALMRPGRVPFVPDIDGLLFQAVHSLDAGQAYRLAATSEVRGAFNIAADPVLDPHVLARVFQTRRLRVPARALRSLAALSWRLHLQPSPPGWLDMALAAPIMDTSRARHELGWMPRYSSTEALLELLAGIHDGAGAATAPLSPSTTGRLRVRQLVSGIRKRP